MTKLFIFVIALSIGALVIGFKQLSSFGHVLRRQQNKFSQQATWQEEFDSFLNIDTSCDSRRDLATKLVQEISTISSDVLTAISTRDLEKVAPSNLLYGKQLKNAKLFRNQLINDIIPDLLTQQIPKIVTAGPQIIQKLSSSITTEKISTQASELVTFARDLSQDPSLLQSTVDTVQQEVRNIFRSTPEGLYTPPYDVLKTTDNYEVRRYSSYSVASTTAPTTSSDENISEILENGKSFNTLANYLLNGDNESSEKLAMTTPVIMKSGTMDFVLPEGFDSESAPKPNSDYITIIDIPAEIVAVKEFTGIATEKEIARQRALLEDSLLADGVLYDNLSFKTFQYNPPYTLPWVRRNEVSLNIQFTFEVAAELVIEEINLGMSPEAGD